MSNETLVIGSGLAGLLTAIDLAEYGLHCMLVTKASLPASNTSFAQGGIAAVTPFSTVDSIQNHLQDTVKAGAGLSDPDVAELIVGSGYTLVQRLMRLGISFDKLLDNIPSLAREGGHSYARVLHRQDSTGNEITAALIKQLRSHPNITVMENTPVASLIVDDDGSCRGAIVLVDHHPMQIWASSVVLATGGLGRLYSRTTNPSVATGDGIALAYRAGARVIDMEFVQFHPTALMLEGAPAFLISEAVRGAGAILLDAHHKRFAQRFHSAGELATRDVVARAMRTIMKEQNTSCVWLDMRSIKADLTQRFPNIVNQCRRFGLDPLTQPIPVAPAAHYFMGGVWADINGLSSIPRLYAIGECACVGLHGANRLASNSLLEAGVMADRVAQSIAEDELPFSYPKLSTSTLNIPDVFADPDRLPTLMYDKVGLERDEAGLTEFLYKASGNHKPASKILPKTLEQANMLTVSKLIAESAQVRQESRGSHWRRDFPALDDHHYLKRYYQSTSGSGWLELSTGSGSASASAATAAAAPSPSTPVTFVRV